ncbi:MAG: DUF5333 family protein [Paracoccaceae bacterium]
MIGFARAGLVAMALAGPASAQVPLNENAHITTSLVAAQVGDMIRKGCGTIWARYLVVFEKMGELEAYARAEGYTEDEVRAFLRDKTEKARIRSLAGAYLAAAGLDPAVEDTYCTIGEREIAAGTLAGSLLRSWK